MITLKASQEHFTYAEPTNLPGICAEHQENIAKRHRLASLREPRETQGNQTDEWFFRPWDLMVLATLFRRCAHECRRSLHGVVSRNARVLSHNFHTSRRCVSQCT
jgi:hypothetical protein